MRLRCALDSWGISLSTAQGQGTDDFLKVGALIPCWPSIIPPIILTPLIGIQAVEEQT